MTIRNISLALGILAISTISFGQKKNETSAAVEYKNKFMPAFQSQKLDVAKKSILAAKKFIDLAAAHPDTKESQKTLLYKGNIYSSLAILSAMDSTLTDVTADDAIDIAIKAFEHGYGVGKKYKQDIEESVYKNSAMLAMAAGVAYEAEQFAEAAEAYEIAGRYSDAIGIMDSNYIFNAALCYDKSSNFDKAAVGYERLAKVGYRGTASAVLASRAYRSAGNLDKAKEVISFARKANPTDRELLLELVNTNIDAGDAAGAEKALAGAIASDPGNKQLHYTIGTIYIDLNESAKAEQSLRKSLEIDPDYVDAQYQLGAHLFNWANELKTEASALKIGDPKYNALNVLSSEKMDGALEVLEQYIANNANDKAVLTILYQAHHKKGNSEKAMEYKKRADAL